MLLHEKGVGFDQHDRVCKAAGPADAVEGITLHAAQRISLGRRYRYTARGFMVRIYKHMSLPSICRAHRRVRTMTSFSSPIPALIPFPFSTRRI
jgi:hypothetical protein